MSLLSVGSNAFVFFPSQQIHSFITNAKEWRPALWTDIRNLEKKIINRTSSRNCRSVKILKEKSNTSVPFKYPFGTDTPSNDHFGIECTKQHRKNHKQAEEQRTHHILNNCESIDMSKGEYAAKGNLRQTLCAAAVAALTLSEHCVQQRVKLNGVQEA